MDFVVGLPRSKRGHDAIWVIVDRLTKVAHFIPVREYYRVPKLVDLYIEHILRLHGVPRSIVSDRGSQFTHSSGKACMIPWARLSTTALLLNPQTDGQTERVNQVLKDLLRACVLTYISDWEMSLPYAEFSYNNYQASFKMAPFEALYGRKCRAPLMWSEVGERTFFSPAAIVEAEENVAKVGENLKITQSRQRATLTRKEKTSHSMWENTST
jgi:hypothetical protein